PTATLPSRRTDTMVVAWKRWGSMGDWFRSDSHVELGPRRRRIKPRRISARRPSGVFLSARARMRGVVHLRQMAEVQVRIDLRGRNVGMSEQLLHAAQVAGAFQHMTGETV